VVIQIATGDPRPIFKQIVDQVRLKIATGELVPGSKLPSVRGLAMQLRVNVNTVAKAYNELTAEGVIESQKGVGVFLREPRQLLSEDERARRLEEAVQRFVAAVLPLGFDAATLLERVGEGLEGLRLPSTGKQTKEESDD
jgi:GntR family transcriptional regulator